MKKKTIKRQLLTLLLSIFVVLSFVKYYSLLHEAQGIIGLVNVQKTGNTLTITATAGSGGSLSAGTYYFRVATISTFSPLSISQTASCTVSASGKCTIAWTPHANAVGTDYRIYYGTTAAQVADGASSNYFTGTSISNNSASLVVSTTAGATSANIPTGYNTATTDFFGRSGSAYVLGSGVNLGIGKTNPNQALDVVGDVVLTSGSVACGTASENSSATVTCPYGATIASITYASYGTPSGSCGAFTNGTCGATDSAALASNACLGGNTCTVAATNAVFGDPCNGTSKNLKIQVTCNYKLYNGPTISPATSTELIIKNYIDTKPTDVPTNTPTPTPTNTPTPTPVYGEYGYGY